MFRRSAVSLALIGVALLPAGCGRASVPDGQAGTAGKSPSPPATTSTGPAAIGGAQQVALHVPEMTKRLDLA